MPNQQHSENNEYDSTNEAQQQWEEAKRKARRFSGWSITHLRDGGWQAITAAITVVGLLVGTIVAVIYWGQWDTMQKQLESSERPWIYADIVPTGDMTVTKDRIFLTLTVSLKNVGHSPANNVRISAFITNYTGPDTPDQVQQRACRTAESGNRMAGASQPMVIFPGQDIVLPHMAFNSPLPTGQSIEVPVISGCLDYAFASTGAHHQTGFAYQVIDFRNNVRTPAPDATISAIQLITFENPLITYQFFFAN